VPGEAESRAGELVQLARLDGAAAGQLSVTRLDGSTAGRLPVTWHALSAARIARCRALAARSPAYWPGLAHALCRAGPGSAEPDSGSAEARREGIAILQALGQDGTGIPAELGYLLSSPAMEQAAAGVIRAWRRTLALHRYADYSTRMRWLILELHEAGLEAEALQAAREAVATERAELIAGGSFYGTPIPAGTGFVKSALPLHLALQFLADSADRAGHLDEAVRVTREAVSVSRTLESREHDVKTAWVPDALLDLSIRLSKAGPGEEPGPGRSAGQGHGPGQEHSVGRGAEAAQARAEMLRLARERLTRGGPPEYATLDTGETDRQYSPRAGLGARVLAELAWEDAVTRGRVLVRPDGRMDLPGLIEEFAAFWREHGELPGTHGCYLHIAPDRILLALLRRAVGAAERASAAGNAGAAGNVDAVFRSERVERSRREVVHARADVLVRKRYLDASGEPAEQLAAIQVHDLDPWPDRRWHRRNAWYRGNPVATALVNLDELLEEHEMDSGILVLMDRRPRKGRRDAGRAGRAAPASRLPDPRITQARTPGGRDATVLALLASIFSRC
jgi:hypothetical protein